MAECVRMRCQMAKYMTIHMFHSLLPFSWSSLSAGSELPLASLNGASPNPTQRPTRIERLLHELGSEVPEVWYNR